MKKKDEIQQPAFPLLELNYNDKYDGLTKREWFASMANEEDIHAAAQIWLEDKPKGATMNRANARFFHADLMIAAGKK